MPNPNDSQLFHHCTLYDWQVSLLNFMITVDGLTAQLLDMAVSHEKPNLQRSKNELIVQGAENKRAMQQAEDKILEVRRH